MFKKKFILPNIVNINHFMKILFNLSITRKIASDVLDNKITKKTF